MSIKQLFCKHKYSVIGKIHCTYQKNINSKKIYTDVVFLECILCNKRTVLMENKFYYTESMLKLINLWQKHQLEIDFESFKNLEEVQNDR